MKKEEARRKAEVPLTHAHTTPPPHTHTHTSWTWGLGCAVGLTASRQLCVAVVRVCCSCACACRSCQAWWRQCARRVWCVGADCEAIHLCALACRSWVWRRRRKWLGPWIGLTTSMCSPSSARTIDASASSSAGLCVCACVCVCVHACVRVPVCVLTQRRRHGGLVALVAARRFRSSRVALLLCLGASVPRCSCLGSAV